MRTIHTAHRYGPRAWPVAGATRTIMREYERGTLLIDVLVPADRSLVWRGSASARIREKSDPAQREQRIEEAVEAILDRFPPK